jgi:hypothetical protein
MSFSLAPQSLVDLVFQFGQKRRAKRFDFRFERENAILKV